MNNKCLLVPLALFLIGIASVVKADVLYGSIAGDATSPALAGHIVTIDPITGVGTDLGVPIPGTGITGLAFDSSGRLLGATSRDGGVPRLIEIDPATGGLISVIAPLTFGGVSQAVTDLGFDPTTGILYANGAFGAVGGNDGLLAVDMVTGAMTLIGRILTEGGFKAIASSDGGALYSISTFGTSLYALNPADASILGSLGLGPAAGVGALGMTVASDGRVFFTDGDGPGRNDFGRDLWVTDPSTGTTTFVGSIMLDGNVHDLAFLRERVNAVPEPTSLTLVGIGVASLLGFGWKRRRNSVVNAA